MVALTLNYAQDGQTYVDQALKFWIEQDFTTISQIIRQENGDKNMIFDAFTVCCRFLYVF